MPKTYKFEQERKFLKAGYFMKDESGSMVYEAKMLTQPLIGASDFEFINHLTGTTTSHKVSKTLTIETGEGLVTNSKFKFDGKNIWDFLHEEGIRIDSSMSKGKLGLTYNVTLKGRPMATIATSSPNGKSPVTVKNFLDVTVEDDKDLDLAFLVAFASARTEQSFLS
ncbi:MAG: hypothetical protein IJR31_03630 [Lachnospiraceae bacterium]|nr:hypothetical protein [Lachnospiraceae bacterium]